MAAQRRARRPQLHHRHRQGLSPRLVRLGRGPGSRRVALLYVALTILAPLLVLLAAAMSAYTWSGQYSLEHLWTALNSEDVWLTMRNSVLDLDRVGDAGDRARHRDLVAGRAHPHARTQTCSNTSILLPISVPGIAFGVGVMLTWVGAPVAVYGTVLIIMFAFIGRFTAYAVRSVSASLVQLHPELEESARVCGYGPLRTFTRITLPLILAERARRLAAAVQLLHDRALDGRSCSTRRRTGCSRSSHSKSGTSAISRGLPRSRCCRRRSA